MRTATPWKLRVIMGVLVKQTPRGTHHYAEGHPSPNPYHLWIMCQAGQDDGIQALRSCYRKAIHDGKNPQPCYRVHSNPRVQNNAARCNERNHQVQRPDPLS